ncbi:MAG: T9SS type A sorting domain-containing protein [Flavobacteriales bacterium]|nr:T9SS type A sorting domain-containing protein [Flavobacteriales bacterium]
MRVTLLKVLSRVSMIVLFLSSTSALSAQDPSNDINCQDWVVYYANILDSDVTDIYQIDIEGSNANMSLIATSQIEVHIAYNDDDDLIYAISNNDGSYRTLNPHVENPSFGPTNMIDADVSGITAAAFSPEGELYIGSASANTVYKVDINDNSVTAFDENIAVSGGDIEFDQSGNLYLATRDNGGELFLVGTEEKIGDVPSVTGMSLSSSNQLLASHDNATTLLLRNLDGTEEESINLLLGGEAFETSFGDMASGCNSFFVPEEGDCQAFDTFYMDNATDNPTLYHLVYSGTNAVLTPVYQSDFRAHIAFDAENNIVYLVNRNGNEIALVDPDLGFIGIVDIQNNLNNAYAVVYNPADELLYVGDSNDEEIYKINPVTGETELFAETPVQGGDLAIQDGVLYLAERNAKDLYQILSPSEISIVGELPGGTSGMAQANNNTTLVISKANSSKFIELGTDGTEINEYIAVLNNGAPFTLANGGDMAAGCADADDFEACGYELFMTNQVDNGIGYSLFGVDINELSGEVTLDLLEDNIGGGHIGLSPDGGTIYVVSGTVVRTYEVGVGLLNTSDMFDGSTNDEMGAFTAVAVNSQGVLHVAGFGNKIYTLNPATGEGTLIGSADVNGGDLFFAPTGDNEAEELWIVNRLNNSISRAFDPTNGQIFVDVEQMYGAALLPNGNVLIADGNGDGTDGFYEVDLTDGSVMRTYDLDLTMLNGDLAGKCTDIEPAPSVNNEAIVDELFGAEVNSFPNPTEGQTQVVFKTDYQARTTIEVYDLSGRIVSTLFSGVTAKDIEYRENFDGSALPEGVYIFRLTNDKQTIIEKFMIAR